MAGCGRSLKLASLCRNFLIYREFTGKLMIFVPFAGGLASFDLQSIGNISVLGGISLFLE